MPGKVCALYSLLLGFFLLSALLFLVGFDSSPARATAQSVGFTAKPLGSPTCVTAFHLVPSPNASDEDNSLFAVAALSSSDVWAAGIFSDPSSGQRTLAEHWNGQQWSIIPTAPGSSGTDYLLGISASSADDVWAVGNIDTGGPTHTLAERWNGSQWVSVPSQDVGTGGSYRNGGVALSPD